MFSGDGEVVEQVISQQTSEQEEFPVRHSSLLDEAIRNLQEQMDGQNQPGGDEGLLRLAEEQGPALAPAQNTLRRGFNTALVMLLNCFSCLWRPAVLLKVTFCCSSSVSDCE